MTYGNGREKVKREKLKNPDKVKYYIHDAIKSVLPACKNAFDLRISLEKLGIEIEYKWKRTVKEIEGVSFRYDDIAFKGSEVDRKFSFGNLKKEFLKNILDEDRRMEEKYQKERKDAEQKQQPTEQKAKPEASPANHSLVILGVELSAEQEKVLRNCGVIFLENMNRTNGNGKFSSHVFLNDEKNKVFFSRENPDSFVKYGQYEMRIRDKILVENGYVTKAKVKWWGGGSYAYPYLWKVNNSDTEYQESLSDPRLQKEEQKPKETKQKAPKVQEKKRGRGI